MIDARGTSVLLTSRDSSRLAIETTRGMRMLTATDRTTITLGRDNPQTFGISYMCGLLVDQLESSQHPSSMPCRVVDISPSHELPGLKENLRRYTKFIATKLKRRRQRLRYEEGLETSGTDDARLHAIAVGIIKESVSRCWCVIKRWS